MIVGANGHVGRLLVAQLLAKGMNRLPLRPDEDGRTEDQGIAVRRLDLLEKPERIASTFMDAEAIILPRALGP